jgi:hypothetical protein
LPSSRSQQRSPRAASRERNTSALGKNFVVKVTEPSFVKRGQADTQAIPAVYKDGMLEISTGFGTSKISYVKDTDTLLMPTMGGSMEFRRVK